MDALLSNLAELCEGEYLKAAAIGEDRTVPRHEMMEPSEAGNELFSGPYMEVVGIAENNLRAEPTKFLGGHGFDGRLGADRHEDRCLNGASARLYGGRTGISFGRLDSKLVAQSK